MGSMGNLLQKRKRKTLPKILSVKHIYSLHMMLKTEPAD